MAHGSFSPESFPSFWTTGPARRSPHEPGRYRGSPPPCDQRDALPAFTQRPRGRVFILLIGRWQAVEDLDCLGNVFRAPGVRESEVGEAVQVRDRPHYPGV